MNTKILKSIGFMALGAVAMRGAGGIFPATTNPKLLHGSLAGVSMLGALKVENPNFQSAFIGASLVKALDFGKSLIDNTSTATKLLAKTDKASAFLRSATGLGCPCEDALGYAEDEAYLNGSEEMYVDENGNVVALGYAEDEAYLNGSEEMFVDENGNVVALGSTEEQSYLMGTENEDLKYL